MSATREGPVGSKLRRTIGAPGSRVAAGDEL